jgi:hypothetical protein
MAISLAEATKANAKKYVVLTGSFSKPRLQIHKFLESNGVRVGSHVRPNALMLVAGEDMLAKTFSAAIDKAKKLGIPVIDEVDLDKLLLKEGITKTTIAGAKTINFLPSAWEELAKNYITSRRHQKNLFPLIRKMENGGEVSSETIEEMERILTLCKKIEEELGNNYFERERIGRWVATRNMSLPMKAREWVSAKEFAGFPAQAYDPTGLGFAGPNNEKLILDIAKDDLTNFSQERVVKATIAFVDKGEGDKVKLIESFFADNHGASRTAMRRRFHKFLSEEVNSEPWHDFCLLLYWLAPFDVIDTSVPPQTYHVLGYNN